MSSPAEERAAREGTFVLAVLPFDLLNVASGHPMMVQAIDGTEVLLRLLTADEAMTMHLEAIASLGNDRPPTMTRRAAEQLVKPLSI